MIGIGERYTVKVVGVIIRAAASYIQSRKEATWRSDAGEYLESAQWVISRAGHPQNLGDLHCLLARRSHYNRLSVHSYFAQNEWLRRKVKCERRALV